MYGNLDMAQVMYGENARQVPAWMYIQDHGDGIVSFVGSSRGNDPHPLRYGSRRTHQFIVGEAIIRPHLVVATNTLRGEGLGNLAISGHDIGDMLDDGEVLIGRWP